MIACLRGILTVANPESIIIEVSGVGYEVQIHSRTHALLPAVGISLLVHTYLQVLDNDLKLFGFLNRQELDLFKILLGVSGIGARGALNILATLTPGDFFRAIASGDEKRLLAVPGIGKKSAQRLVFELKDKVGNQPGLGWASADDGAGQEEIMEALETLGYQRSEIFPLLMEMKNQGEFGERVEDNIKRVLRRKAMQMKK